MLGGTGFLGAAFVRRLRDLGHPVAVLSREPDRVAARFPGLRVEARGGDVRDPDGLAAAMRGAEVAIQAVQFPGFPVEDPSRDRTFMTVDAAGTRNAVEAARAAGVRRIVYLSGVGADAASPRTWYRAKGLAEEGVRGSGLEHCIVRPSWVYGPEDRSLNRFAAILRRVPLAFPQLGDGTQRLNPVFIRDVAEAVARAARDERVRAETVEIGGPETYTMDGIVRILMRALGVRRRILHVPAALARAGAAVLERLPGRPFTRDAVTFVTQGAVARNEALMRLFPDLRPTPMPEALASYLAS